MANKALMLGCVITFCFAPHQSRASPDEFVGLMSGHVLGFAMLAEQFSVGPCSKYFPNPGAHRIYRDSESKVFALLPPRLRRELKAGLSKEPHLVRQGAEQMLKNLSQMPASSEREKCMITSVMISSLHQASLQIFQEYASTVGIK